MSRRRVLAGLAAMLLVIGAGGVALYQQVGRTPTELIAYTRLRLDGHPRLEFVALPILNALETQFAIAGVGNSRAPFTVPRLAANPALAASHTRMSADRGDSVPGLLRVGPGRAITNIGTAAKLAKDGDVVEIDPGDYLGDVAVWTQNDLVIRGMGARVRLIANGANAEGKAIWVLRGGRITVEGIDFIGARVPDGNGAGIRFERGHLVVRRCLFFDNQNGILASPNPDNVLEVAQSEFGYNGAGDGRTHHLDASQIRQLTVTGSYFHHANVGHLIKSRAFNNLIAYNRLSDEAGGRASCELEFPEGGMARVVGNLVQQGSQTSNSVMVSYGAEGLRRPVNQLQMAYNTLVNDHPHGGTFVRTARGAGPVLLLDNLLLGRGALDLPDDAVQQRNHRLDWADVARAVREDWRLTAAARARLRALPVTEIDAELLPRQEYVHPTGLRALDGPQRWPGALQSPGP